MSSSVLIFFCSLVFMFLSVALPSAVSSGPIMIEKWMPRLSESDRALDAVRRMSSISVGMPACLRVEAILCACGSVSFFSGIIMACLVSGSLREVCCFSIARMMRLIPGATPTAGVGSPPKSSMSLSYRPPPPRANPVLSSSGTYGSKIIPV